MARDPGPKRPRKRKPPKKSFLDAIGHPRIEVDAKGNPRVVDTSRIGSVQEAERKRKQEILKRQRLLRAKGYKIVVDGIWGPRSQEAWRKHRAGILPAQPEKRPAIQQTQPESIQQQRREQRTRQTALKARLRAEQARRRAAEVARQSRLRSEARAEESKVRSEVSRRKKLFDAHERGPGLEQREQERRHREAIFLRRPETQRLIKQGQAKLVREKERVAARARKKAPEQWSVRELVTVTVDPDTGDFNPRDRRQVTAVQRWLAAHGAKGVTVNGQYDKATFKALVSTVRRFQREERRQQEKAIVGVFYDSGVIKPGDKDFPLIGTAPKPGELLEMFQKGGFTAALIYRQLVERALFDPQVQFLALREQQLSQLETTLFGTFKPPTWIGKQSPQMRAAQIAVMIDNNRRAAAQYAGDDQAALKKVVGDIGASQVMALAESRDQADFQRRLKTVARQDEAEYLAQQAEKAQGRSWWGTVSDVFVWPVDQVEKYGVGSAIAAYELVTTVAAYKEAGGGAAGRAKVAGSLTGESFERAEAFFDAFEKNHPWFNLAMEALIDPLNFVPVVGPAKAVGTGTVKVALSMERAGLYVGARGDVVRGAARPFVIPFTKATETGLVLPAAFGRTVKAGAQAARDDVPVLVATQHFAKKLSRAKTETLNKVNGQVRTLVRTGFRSGSTKSGNDVPSLSYHSGLSQAYDEAAEAFAAAERAWAPEVAATLAKARVSVFADDGRYTESEVWGAIVGDLASRARAIRVQNRALKVREARIAEFREEWLPGGVIPDVIPDEVPVYPGRSREESFLHWLDVESKRLGDEEYRAYMERIGAYFFGNGDPELVAEIDDIVQRDIDWFLGPYAKTIQDEIEDVWENADSPGLSLFNEQGRWVGNNTGIAELLRGMLRDTFDELDGVAAKTTRTIEIPNQNYGRQFTRSEMNDIIAREASQAASRIRSWAARARAAGRAIPDAKVDELTQQALDDIGAKWSPVEGRTGYFEQTNEMVRVPAFSVRHLESVWGSAMRGEHPILTVADVPEHVKSILRVGGTPIEKMGDPLSEALDRAVFARVYGAVVDRETFTAHPGLINLPPGFNDAAFDQLLEYRKAMEEYALATQQMTDEAVPRLFTREWAFYQALAEAQSKPLQYLYNGLQAWLDWWVTYTLPLRPAFWVRNRVDNWAKMFVAGMRDPRNFWLGGAEQPSIFSWPIRGLRHALTIGGRGENNPAVHFLDALIEKVWELETPVIEKIFKAHAVPVPPEAIDAMKQSVAVRRTFNLRRPVYAVNAADDEALRNPALVAHAHWKEIIWDLTTSGPEASDKRRLYRWVFHRETGRGATRLEAHEAAMREIDKTLFDYSKLSTIEDNFRWFFPFVFFWQRSMRYWVEKGITKPWLPAEVVRFEETLQENVHADQPEWMRRYVDANPILNTLAKVPGLSYLIPQLTDFDVMTDPLNYFSFNVIYKTFKSENEGLPPDKAGIKFLGDLMDAINDFGLSANPAFRKPLEVAGVFNFRAWQMIFPQTSLVDAFSQAFLQEMFPDGLNIEAMLEDKVLQAIGSDFSVTEKIAERFDYFVQMEMAAQGLRGEKVSRTAAEKKIRAYFYVMNAVGYTVGFFPRYMDAQHYHLYKLADEFWKGTKQWDDLTRTEQRAYQLFKRRRWDPVAYDNYLDRVPKIEAYYAIEDYDRAQEFKAKHPEILQDVEPAWNGKEVFSHNYVAKIGLVMDTESSIRMFDLAKDIDAAQDVKELAERTFVTNELRNFWSVNNTPKEKREEMIRGFVYRHLEALNDQYHAIPATDYDAKEAFLRDNPVLRLWWDQNNSRSDDLMNVVNQSNASLREVYFSFVDRKDWDSAAAFLKQFPFIFKFTKSEDRVTEDGLWLPAKKGSQHARDWLAAKPHLDHYFDVRSRDKQAAYRWLDSADQGAAIVRRYFAKYGKRKGKGRTQHSRDYLRMKSKLKWFFQTLPKKGSFRDHESKWEWVAESDDPVARELRDYFRKYGDKKGQTQHARDYVAAKEHLQRYFDLAKEERSDWLKGGSKSAAIVLAYFKKYGKQNSIARQWAKWAPLIAERNPELARRLAFWTRYWQLDPDERPAFVIDKAEEYGVFVWGPLGDEQLAAKKAEYLRWAKTTKLSEKMAMYLRFKPMLDLMRTLDDRERKLFLRANPDLQDYLDRYSKRKLTGDKALDKVIERYFKLPEESPERDAMLKSHPKLADYFERDASDADKAMFNLLDVFFKIEDKDEREQFLEQHPQIEAYFDRKKAEREAEKGAAEVFDLVDPRLAALRELAQTDIIDAGDTMRSRLREEAARRHQPKTIETRRRRRQEPTTVL